jgi:hypothetical protein
LISKAKKECGITPGYFYERKSFQDVRKSQHPGTEQRILPMLGCLVRKN